MARASARCLTHTCTICVVPFPTGALVGATIHNGSDALSDISLFYSARMVIPKDDGVSDMPVSRIKPAPLTALFVHPGRDSIKGSQSVPWSASFCWPFTCGPYTRRQSVMTRPMQPRPATSTTFSCQLSNTLIPAPADSFAAPGRPPTWLKPVCWGVIRVGVRGALDPEDVDAMPLYLYNCEISPRTTRVLKRRQ